MLNDDIIEEIVIVPTNRYYYNINIHNLSLQLIVTSNIIYILRTRNRKRPSDEQIEIINKKKRVANISPSKVNIINKKKRVANLSLSKKKSNNLKKQNTRKLKKIKINKSQRKSKC